MHPRGEAAAPATSAVVAAGAEKVVEVNPVMAAMLEATRLAVKAVVEAAETAGEVAAAAKVTERSEEGELEASLWG